MLSALGSVALGGWVMAQASIASRPTATLPAAASASASAPSVAGALTPEQLAALQFNLPAASAKAAPAAPLRPVAAPKRVSAPAPPAATTGTS